jgi:hypothetical protein
MSGQSSSGVARPTSCSDPLASPSSWTVAGGTAALTIAPYPRAIATGGRGRSRRPSNGIGETTKRWQKPVGKSFASGSTSLRWRPPTASRGSSESSAGCLGDGYRLLPLDGPDDGSLPKPRGFSLHAHRGQTRVDGQLPRELMLPQALPHGRFRTLLSAPHKHESHANAGLSSYSGGRIRSQVASCGVTGLAGTSLIA